MADDTIGTILFYNHKFSDHDFMGNTDSSIIVNERSAHMFAQRGRHREAAMAVGANVRNYVKKERIANARRAMETYDRESGLFKGDDIEKGREIFYNMKATYFLAVDSVDSAAFYLRKELRDGHDLNNQSAAVKGLAQLYGATCKKDSALKYAFVAMSLEDTLTAHRQDLALGKLDAIYNYQVSKRQAENERKEKEKGQNTSLLIEAILTVLVAGGGLAFYKTRKKSREVLAETQSRYIKALAGLEERKRTLEKMRKLTGMHQSRIRDYQKAIDQKEERVRELKRKVDEYEKVYGIDAASHLDGELRSAPVFRRFELFCEEEATPGKADWAELEAVLDGLVPKFRKVIFSHAKLNENEYRLCMLVRFGFKPKEIAFLTGGAFANISVARSRLLKRIFDVEGTPKDFDRMVRAIS